MPGNEAATSAPTPSRSVVRAVATGSSFATAEERGGIGDTLAESAEHERSLLLRGRLDARRSRRGRRVELVEQHLRARFLRIDRERLFQRRARLVFLPL